MKKFLLSGLIGVPVLIGAQVISDTFIAGAFAGMIYSALDALLVERRA